MNHSRTLFLKNPPITFKRSVLSQPLASASIIRFSKNEIGSFLIFSKNGFGMIIGFPLFDCPLIIYLATTLFLFLACSLAFSLIGIFIFLWTLECQGFL